ncbi:MAG: hypothetical protein EOO14_25505 [Chitinophagaceae bacterium]|nr:MAG: hypothetical protein EOO14_25505 [Chitinophagaceae bacterium]
MSNLTTNRIDEQFTSQEVTDINDFITQLEAKFNGKLRTLTKSERIALPKIKMLAGSEAYQNALAVYRMAQEAARNGQPGADAVADKLKTRFLQAATPIEPEAPAAGFSNS